MPPATCGPPDSNSEAGEDEEGVEVQEETAASNPGSQDSVEEEEGDEDDEEGDEDEEEDDNDESQRPPKAQQTFAVVNLDSEDEEVAIVYGPQPKPPTIVINDDDDEVTEVTGPQRSSISSSGFAPWNSRGQPSPTSSSKRPTTCQAHGPSLRPKATCLSTGHGQSGSKRSLGEGSKRPTQPSTPNVGIRARAPNL